MDTKSNLLEVNEILNIKKEIKFYLKESIKNIIKLPLTFIKQISLYALSLSNKIIPIVILLLIPMSTTWILITAISFIIVNIIVDIKINNSDKHYINELAKASDNFCNATYNLIELCEKLRKLKENNNQKEIILEQKTNKQKETSSCLVLENDEIKHSQESQTIFLIDKKDNKATNNIKTQVDESKQKILKRKLSNRRKR